MCNDDEIMLALSGGRCSANGGEPRCQVDGCDKVVQRGARCWLCNVRCMS